MSSGDSREVEEKKRKSGRSWRRRLFFFTLKWGFVGGIWAGFFALIFVAWCAYDLPDVSKLNEIKRRASVSLIAADGSLIASYGDLYGSAAALKDLPAYLPQAVIATEDRRFYSHFGLDLRESLTHCFNDRNRWRPSSREVDREAFGLKRLNINLAAIPLRTPLCH